MASGDDDQLLNFRCRYWLQLFHKKMIAAILTGWNKHLRLFLAGTFMDETGYDSGYKQLI